MYARKLKYKNQWNYVAQHCKYFCSSNCRDYSIGQYLSTAPRASSLTERYVPDSSLLSEGWCKRSSLWPYVGWRNCSQRFYSSEGDGRNASEDKRVPNKDVVGCEKEKIPKENTMDNARHCDAHARLGEQDQMEWLKNEKIAIDNKKKESSFLTRRERFRNEFLRRITPWEKITVSWDNFPYYVHEHTKNLLVECTASHLKHKKFTTDYGGRLISASGRILLQSIPGTELYRERLVRALARDLQVPVLVLDSSILAPHDFNEDESESDEENSGCTSESEIEDENDASNEEDYTSSGEGRTDGSDDEVDINVSAENLRKLLPGNVEEFEKSVSGEPERSSASSKPETSEQSDMASHAVKKGDRVKYIGPSVCFEANNRIVLGKIPTSDGPTNAYTIIRGRTLSSGQRGEVYEVNGDRAAVVFDISCKTTDEVKDAKSAEATAKPSVCWLHVKDIEHDLDAQTHDSYIAMEVLCEVLESQQPLVVYFPDSSLWLSKAVSKSNRKEFVSKMQELFDKLSGPVVLICGQNKLETGSNSKEKEKFTMILPNLGRLAKLPLLKRLAEGLRPTKRSGEDEIHKLFTNVMCLDLPKEEDLLRIFNKQIEEDKRIVVSRNNLSELHKVLEEHDLSCMDLLHVNTDGVVLTKQKAEKVVGWAKNHYLSSCLLPSVKGDRMQVPRESLELAILRLKEQETASKKPSQNLKNLAKDEYETNFVSAVVPPGEIGVKFDDVGALEDVKKALNELVILPMRRPELFSRGNLLRPCKGILLFGPPGTGKTLMAKALATEAGANFISITGSTLTSKWFGDAEKLTRALFSFASKLAPVIIFVDEVDSLLGARGGAFEHEATRRMRNEFMAAWDGLRSKDSQRILVLGATNRPFDLDDAVIRRLPRRIYVDLPDADNRLKILKIILARENLELGFPLEQLANATEGYSGSDLKNLCIAAAYRPVQELLEQESKGDKFDGVPVLRALKLDDFTQSKAKVGPSVAFDAASMNELRKWNEQYGEGGSRKKSPFGF
ncbi:P-loop containing nucleoside triphosphate hydrolases superfamily protein [Perilla frutescens var. frutescens]|nr:P-loop containing nucleoside triphosphate hydrolases superfamily protein [Perilla frutescens var. frutescens]